MKEGGGGGSEEGKWRKLVYIFRNGFFWMPPLRLQAPGSLRSAPIPSLCLTPVLIWGRRVCFPRAECDPSLLASSGGGEERRGERSEDEEQEKGREESKMLMTAGEDQRGDFWRVLVLAQTFFLRWLCRSEGHLVQTRGGVGHLRKWASVNQRGD